METQEIFDRVVTHLREQGRPARQEGEDPVFGSPCRYRTDGGLKCAVGCLITDEFYSELLEAKSIVHELVTQAVGKSLGIRGLPIEVRDVLNELQRTHDQYLPEEWEQRFERIAADNNLKVPALVGVKA